MPGRRAVGRSPWPRESILPPCRARNAVPAAGRGRPRGSRPGLFRGPGGPALGPAAALLPRTCAVLESAARVGAGRGRAGTCGGLGSWRRAQWELRFPQQGRNQRGTGTGCAEERRAGGRPGAACISPGKPAALRSMLDSTARASLSPRKEKATVNQNREAP